MNNSPPTADTTDKEPSLKDTAVTNIMQSVECVPS